MVRTIRTGGQLIERNGFLSGESTRDTPPTFASTGADIPDCTFYFEKDTGKVFVYSLDSDRWFEV